MDTEKILTAASLKRSIPHKPAYIQVVEQIQQMTKNGELMPGDQLLPERELAEKFGVSRTSLRKGLAVLDGMGLIEVTPRDGAYVQRRTLPDVIEPLAQILFHEREQVAHLFEVRQMIETQAARLAALRRDEQDLEGLRRLNRQFEADLRRGDIAFQANLDFHTGIVKAAKNPILTEIMSTLLRATMEVYALARQRSMAGRTNLLQFVDEHERIIEAIARQDPDRAAMLAAQHLDGARKRIEVEER